MLFPKVQRMDCFWALHVYNNVFTENWDWELENISILGQVTSNEKY